jgi:hypothetical protein
MVVSVRLRRASSWSTPFFQFFFLVEVCRQRKYQ